jgi:hypothetical protein
MYAPVRPLLLPLYLGCDLLIRERAFNPELQGFSVDLILVGWCRRDWRPYVGWVRWSHYGEDVSSKAPYSNKMVFYQGYIALNFYS